jgi:hypothetical protein|eukprot:jgi/Orpsp1_1/1178464/evm.model.c7180000065421.1
MRTSVIISFLACALTVIAKPTSKPDPNFHIYLAFGQSNMEGQGNVEAQDRVEDKRFKLISTADECMGRELGEWYPALPPIVNCYGNLGPIDWFGRTLTKKLPSEIKVGVAPVAVAGCDIQLFEEANYKEYSIPDWMQGRIDHYGGNPFRRLVNIAKKAQKAGVIKGVLLHQGETNNGQEDWPERVKAVYEALLKELDLNAKDVPLLAGEVVREEYEGMCSLHNTIIKKLPDVIPTAHVISAEGLDDGGDDLHFSSASYRILGERYADKMIELLKVKQVDPADEEVNSDEEVVISDDEIANEEDSADEN